MLNVPTPGTARRRIIIEGDVPNPINPPGGCRFHTRCLDVFDRCRSEEPANAYGADATRGLAVP